MASISQPPSRRMLVTFPSWVDICAERERNRRVFLMTSERSTTRSCWELYVLLVWCTRVWRLCCGPIVINDSQPLREGVERNQVGLRILLSNLLGAGQLTENSCAGGKCEANSRSWRTMVPKTASHSSPDRYHILGLASQPGRISGDRRVSSARAVPK